MASSAAEAGVSAVKLQSALPPLLPTVWAHSHVHSFRWMVLTKVTVLFLARPDYGDQAANLVAQRAQCLRLQNRDQNNDGTWTTSLLLSTQIHDWSRHYLGRSYRLWCHPFTVSIPVCLTRQTWYCRTPYRREIRTQGWALTSSDSCRTTQTLRTSSMQL